jgi:hypothetical protein
VPFLDDRVLTQILKPLPILGNLDFFRSLLALVYASQPFVTVPQKEREYVGLEALERNFL